jgi:TrpR family trp operon transcriptional repressor
MKYMHKIPGKTDGKERERRVNELIEAFRAAGHNASTLLEFFADIFTPNELEEVAARWQIVKLLSRHVPHRDIAERLGVGVATVTRGSRELLDERGGFRKVLDLVS